MTRVQKRNVGDGQTKLCFSNEKKVIFGIDTIFFFKARKPNKRGVTWRKFSDQKFWVLGRLVQSQFASL